MKLRILGIEMTDVTVDGAVAILDDFASRRDGVTRTVFFCNAHSLNVACRDPAYRRALHDSTCVFNDGTGVRWAARMQGVRLKANLNGTDLVPAFFRATGGDGRSFYMLGSAPEIITRAAEHAQRAFEGWELAGYRSGYLDEARSAEVVREINARSPDVLLVGMGNPVQEQWIQRWRGELDVPLCIGVGGLFDFWSGCRPRAPAWVRRAGFEWLHILLDQPHKAKRYLLGNPAFLYRTARERVARDVAAPASSARGSSRP